MKIRAKHFCLKPGKQIDLAKWPTITKPFYKSKTQYTKLLEEHIQGLSALQNLLYVHNRYSLLLIFQAMDAAGKDGAIKHVMSGVNPQGCQVFSFKKPSTEESQHDFLWRTTRCLPEYGRIGIFNRSYYEEVLVVRVHPEILREEMLLPEVLHNKKVWKTRYRSILDLEEHLSRNGTKVIKIFLHVSKEEQRKRFLKRIDDPCKNCKFNLDDLQERARWNEYMKAYEDCLKATTSKNAPWYVIPADDKKNARLMISQVILETLQSLKMTYPKPDGKHLKELRSIRKLLAKA